MQMPPPIIESNAPHVSGSPWLIDRDQAQEAATVAADAVKVAQVPEPVPEPVPVPPVEWVTITCAAPGCTETLGACDARQADNFAGWLCPRHRFAP